MLQNTSTATHASSTRISGHSHSFVVPIFRVFFRAFVQIHLAGKQLIINKFIVRLHKSAGLFIQLKSTLNLS